MKTGHLTVLILFVCNGLKGQAVDVEQYYYTANSDAPQFVSVLGYKASHNWYAEARYNYEDFHTFSINAGRVFSDSCALSYEATPMLGLAFGNFKGGSAGLKLNMTYKKFILYSQTQYSFSSQDKSLNYLYNWSEISYPVKPWSNVGIAVQQTRFQPTERLQPGLMINFCYRNFNFPVYMFDLTNQNTFLVFGIMFNWKKQNSKHLKL